MSLNSRKRLCRLAGLLVLAACLGSTLHAAETESTASRPAVLRSPDGRIELTFKLRTVDGVAGCPSYSVNFRGKPLVAPSGLGFELEDGSRLADSYTLAGAEFDSADESWQPVYGERSAVRDIYQLLQVELVHEQRPGHRLGLTFRCYDAGVALQYHIRDESQSAVAIRRELTEFRFLEDHTAWCVRTAQGEYETRRLSSLGSEVERPLTLQVDDTTYAAIAEARLVDYARMKLQQSPDRRLSVVSQLSSSVKASLPLSTPWRVIMLAESPGQLLENNDILLNLNAPNAIADPSWIKPGKVIREVTLTTQGGKACVDFAVAHGLQYVEYDAGWYGNEYDDASDATTVTLDPKRSRGPLDLHEVIRYAQERDIGIILYVNRRALERQIDELLPLYRQWGIKGLKYGFVNVGSQEWTSWLHEAIRKAADYQMMVDVHDEYRPTGYSRTYPNFMTQEGIGGDETSPSNEQTLTILFTRMLAGAGDNTICYFDSRVDKNATHAYQLAKAVCFYSPWQFLYWYDRPQQSPRRAGGAGGQMNVIGDEPELEFYKHVPTVWDETRVLQGRIGEHAVIARRSGDEWFVGCMHSGPPRSFQLPLDFLAADQTYMADIYADDPQMDTRTQVGIERREVNSQTVLEISLLANGGQAMRLVPTTQK